MSKSAEATLSRTENVDTTSVSFSNPRRQPCNRCGKLHDCSSLPLNFIFSR